MADKHLIRVPGARRLPPLGTDFVHVEVLSGIVLALATVAALVLGERGHRRATRTSGTPA